MAAPIPLIEITHDAYAKGVWSPHREVHTGHSADLADVRAEFFILRVMRAFVHQVDVEIGE